MTDHLKNKYSEAIDNSFMKAMHYIDRHRAIIGYSAVVPLISSIVMGLSMTSPNGQLAAVTVLGSSVAIVGLCAASIAVQAFLPKEDVANPLKHWTGQPAHLVKNGGETLINVPGHIVNHDAKALDAFSLPELTQITGSFKEKLGPEENSDLRALIKQTRHAENVDQLAQPAFTQEMLEKFKGIVNESSLDGIRIDRQSVAAMVRVIERSEGREIPTDSPLNESRQNGNNKFSSSAKLAM